jgi:hypothetical protein
MKIRWQNKHKGSETCAEYTINIYDELWIADDPQGSFEIEAPGFTRSFTSNTDITAAFGIITSTVSFNIDVQPDETLLNNWIRNILPLAQENRFHVEVLKGSGVVFRGTLMTDQIAIPAECAPYTMRLTFTDGLSFLQGFKNYPPLGLLSGGEARLQDARLVVFIQSMLRNVPALNLWDDSEIFLTTNMIWFDDKLDNNLNPLFEAYLTPENILYQYDDDTTPEVVSPSLYEQLNIILKSFHLRLFQDRGFWHVLQVSSYTQDQMTLWNYNRKSVFINDTTQDDSLIPIGGKNDVAYATALNGDPEDGFPYLDAGSVIQYKPALKEVVVTLEDEIRPIGEKLVQAIRNTANPPNQPETRANTWVPIGLVGVILNATIGLRGRARFFFNAVQPALPRLITPYMRIEARIDGTFAFSSPVIYGAYQNYTVTQPQAGVYRHEYLIEFDFNFAQQIPQNGLLEIRVVSEGSLQFGLGDIISNVSPNFMDIRATAEYVPVDGFGRALLLDYKVKNARTSLASSAIYEMSTPLGDVLTDPTANPNGYLDRGGLFIPQATYPFRDFLGKWRFSASGTEYPLLSLFGDRLLKIQNLPVQQLEATVVGDVWFLRNYLTFGGRRFIFNGGSFTSDNENWNVSLVEVLMDNDGVTPVPVFVRSSPQGDERNTGQLTIPPLDTNRYGGAVLGDTLLGGEPLTEVRVAMGNMTVPPSGGRLIIVNPSTGFFQEAVIVADPEIYSVDDNEWRFTVSEITLPSDAEEGFAVFFDSDAIISIMPQLVLGTDNAGQVRRIVIGSEDEQTTVSFVTLTETFTFNVTQGS